MLLRLAGATRSKDLVSDGSSDSLERDSLIDRKKHRVNSFSTFLQAQVDTGSFDSAVASLRDATTSLRMTSVRFCNH